MAEAGKRCGQHCRKQHRSPGCMTGGCMGSASTHVRLKLSTNMRSTHRCHKHLPSMSFLWCLIRCYQLENCGLSSPLSSSLSRSGPMSLTVLPALHSAVAGTVPKGARRHAPGLPSHSHYVPVAAPHAMPCHAKLEKTK